MNGMTRTEVPWEAAKLAVLECDCRGVFHRSAMNLCVSGYTLCNIVYYYSMVQNQTRETIMDGDDKRVALRSETWPSSIMTSANIEGSE